MLLKEVFSLLCEELPLIWQSLEIREKAHSGTIWHTHYSSSKEDKLNKKYPELHRN